MINTWTTPPNIHSVVGSPQIPGPPKRWEEGMSLAGALVGSMVGYTIAGTMGGKLGFGSSYIGFVTKTSVAAASGYLGYVLAEYIWKIEI